MDQKCTNDTRFYYNKDMDENLEWLTQNILKIQKVINSTDTVNVIEL